MPTAQQHQDHINSSSIPTLFVRFNAAEAGRQVLSGLQHYVTAHHLPWRLLPIMPGDDWRLQAYAANGSGPIALAGFIHQPTAHQLRDAVPQLTILSCASSPTGEQIYRVSVDDHLVGRQAMDHLAQAGYHHIVLWGRDQPEPRTTRLRAAEERCRELALSYTRLSRPAMITDRQEAEQWLRKTLRTLPQPCGLFAYQDVDAAYLRSICLAEGLAIPQSFGILGVDDNRNICEQITPELSSVRLPWRHIGTQMARTWHALLSGSAVSREQIIPVYGVHNRQTTDLQLALLQDPLVRTFLRLSQQTRKRPRSLSELAAHCGVSQTTLYRRVKTALNRSPQQIIHDQRIQTASQLLLDSDLPLAAIAKHSGYASPQRLHAAFTQRYGVSPGLWRSG